jgi:flavin reductase (DIM6/NTAB) family NADH-FMN oxidoreductase RutF
MRNWASGVSVVVAEYEGLHGITVNTFTSISLEPPLIMVCLFKETDVAIAIRASRSFTVSILAADQEHLSNRFAGFDPDFPKESDFFGDLDLERTETDVPALKDSLGWVECRVWAIHDGSTHDVILGEVVAASPVKEDEKRSPLIYYHRSYHHITEIEE